MRSRTLGGRTTWKLPQSWLLARECRLFYLAASWAICWSSTQALSQFRLEDRVDAFIEDAARPREIRENLHYFREIANFGAHTQKDDQQEIIDVTEQEAEWTLDILDSLSSTSLSRPSVTAPSASQ